MQTEKQAARAAYMRDYYATHPEQAEKARQRRRARYRAKREEILEYQKAYQRRRGYTRIDPDQRRRYWLKGKLGLTPEDYDRMLEAQGGGCALCGRTDSGVARILHLCIDHDHETGRIRGLLCVGCNISLGYFERGSQSRLEPARARAYLG